MDPTIPDTMSLSMLFTLLTNVIIMISTALTTLLAVPALITLITHFVSKEQRTRKITKTLILGYLCIIGIAVATTLVRLAILSEPEGSQVEIQQESSMEETTDLEPYKAYAKARYDLATCISDKTPERFKGTTKGQLLSNALEKGANTDTIRELAEIYDLMMEEANTCYEQYPVPDPLNLPTEYQTFIDKGYAQGLPETVIWRSTLINLNEE